MSIFNCMTSIVFSFSSSHGESLGNDLHLLLFTIFYIYADLLLKQSLRRYIFPVYLFSIGSYLHETLSNNVYFAIIMSIRVDRERQREKKPTEVQ